MLGERNLWQRVIVGLATGLGVGLLLNVALWLNLLSDWQLHSTDYLYQGWETEGRVVIVGIDDKSLAELGRWHDWPRSYHARLIDALSQAGPRVIALDVLFSEPSADDETLAAAMQRAGNVVLTAAAAPETPAPTRRGQVPQYQRLLKPQPILASAAAGLGHGNILPDDDGFVRRIPLLIEGQSEQVPALALAAVQRFLRWPEEAITLQQQTIRAVGRRIPVDYWGRMLINYAGGPSSADAAGAFPVYPYVDVMQSRVEPAAFADKLVLVGMMSTAEPDNYPTPTSTAGRKMFGVEIHANAIETLRASRFLRSQDLSDAMLVAQMALILLIAVGCGLLLPHIRPVWSAGLVIVLFLAYLVVSSAAFSFLGLILNIIYPGLALLLVFVGVLIYRYLWEERQRRAVAALFGRYVSASLLEQILARGDPESVQLGGEEREISALFADIRGFTSLSESMSPSAVVKVLNSYLDGMADIVQEKHDGFLDKFTGDGLMALFGVPLPQQDHALRAVRAAVDMQAEARRTSLERGPETGDVAYGIGIASGPAVVGNIGSANRLDYTAIGDTVNLAARLEGQAGRGKILIDERTCALVKDAVHVRPLEPTRVKGKRHPVVVYEVLGLANTAIIRR